jgi:phosphate transport system substrate-binding protein
MKILHRSLAVGAALACTLFASGVSAATPTDAMKWERSGRPAPPRELLQPSLDADLPVYRTCGARGKLNGTAPAIVVDVLGGWLRAFGEHEPDVQVEVAPPYLPPQGALNPRLREFLDGHLDFAFLTREMAAADVRAFRRTHGFEPLLVPVAGGSFRHFGFVDAVAVVVHESNPLRGLTLAQLDAIFSDSRHRGGARAIATWDELGVKEWAGHPVRVVGNGAWAQEESARATFFRERVMDGQGRRGQWRANGSAPDEGDAIVVDAVAADRFAIGFTGMGHLASGVHAIAIGPGKGVPLLEPSHDNVASAAYPLSRVFYLAVARRPGQLLPAPLDAFVRFLLSSEGQRIVLSHGVFLPLRESQAANARRMLPAPRCSE